MCKEHNVQICANMHSKFYTGRYQRTKTHISLAWLTQQAYFTCNFLGSEISCHVIISRDKSKKFDNLRWSCLLWFFWYYEIFKKRIKWCKSFSNVHWLIGPWLNKMSTYTSTRRAFEIQKGTGFTRRTLFAVALSLVALSREMRTENPRWCQVSCLICTGDLDWCDPHCEVWWAMIQPQPTNKTSARGRWGEGGESFRMGKGNIGGGG